MDFKEAYDDTCSTVGQACRTGNVDALKRLIAAGKPLDVKGNRGLSSLHSAAYRHPECLEILLQHEDCDVNWQTCGGETALYLASKRGNIDAIKLLLLHGADVNLTTIEKLSPLWEATEKNRLACMRVLVAAGANVNQHTYYGDSLYNAGTPLHLAAKRGNTETVTFLLDKGADMNERNEAGHTPVFIASKFAKHECLKILLEMADQKRERYKGHHGPLVYPILMKLGQNVCLGEISVKFETGSPSFRKERRQFLEIRWGHMTYLWAMCFSVLESITADGYTKHLVNAMATDNATPLLIAAQAGSAECVKLLLDRGANPDIACQVKPTTSNRKRLYVPLHMAVLKEQPSCVELLAPVTTEVKKMYRDFGYNHPVRLAITHDNIRCIQILLDNGYSWKKIYKVIFSYSHGANISMDGETEFCYLIFFEDMSFNVVHYFLRLGIMKPSLNNIQIKTTTDDLRACRVNKFLLLLKYGANPTVLDSNGVNQVAVEIIWNFHVDFMYALIKYGTKLQFGNEQCWRPGIKGTKMYYPTDRKILALVVLCLCSNIHTDEEVRTKKQESGVEKIREASWGLRHACRVKIVRQLISRGKYTTDSVNTLGLPTMLNDYLLYKDFDEFVYDFDESDDDFDDDVDDCRISSLGTEMREAFRKLEMVDSTVEMLMAANEKEF